MDAGGLAQMSHNFAPNGLGMPASGLASRRGGQGIKPLSFDAIKAAQAEKDNGAPTPRTSRSHLLAGLRTAPKTAVASSFTASQTGMPAQHQTYARNVSAGYASQDVYNAPKTALPRFGNQQAYGNNLMQLSQQLTAEQVLAPPEIQIDDHSQDQMDPTMYAQLVATNMYLAQQQQKLQQQLRDVQAAAQQFQGLSIGQQLQQQQLQQQQLQQQQLAMFGQGQYHMQQTMPGAVAPQPNVYAYFDPTTGQQTYYVDQSTAQVASPYVDQSQLAQYAAMQQQNLATPRVQVSPPPEHTNGFRSNSPPKRFESPSEHTPLPPPSANAFRRGHKKASSLANANGLSVTIQDTKAAGPKSAAFPITPLTGGYGPGQARAGEHPIRQPRGPPSFDELSAKPTAKYEGSKNFAARTRRSAVHNLVRAGLERRKGPGSSSNGSMSPVSESAEESETPITDNDSESGHSGPGSLAGDVECSLPSSRTSTSGSWGAIGSDRPGSRQKARDSVGSATSDVDNSFASVFKNGAQKATKAAEPVDGARKGSMLVLTSAEKRKSGHMVMA